MTSDSSLGDFSAFAASHAVYPFARIPRLIPKHQKNLLDSSVAPVPQNDMLSTFRDTITIQHENRKLNFLVDLICASMIQKRHQILLRKYLVFDLNSFFSQL